MNLNFYNPSAMGTNLENLQMNLQDQIDKLNQIRNIGLNQTANSQVKQTQRYYLDCGNREDWNQFLKINYGITENQIFSDYKLFLQAKAELNENKDKEKLEEMKRKITAPSAEEKGNVHSIQPELYQQQSVQPVHSYEQPLCSEQMVQLQPNTSKQQYSNRQSNQTLPTGHEIPNNRIVVDARDITNSGSSDVKSNTINKLDENTRNYQDKGVKHVR